MSDESRTPIRIDSADLYSPQVNEFVEMQQALRRDTGPIDPQPLLVRIIYSNWFYLSLASGLGAMLAWSVLEPFFDDRANLNTHQRHANSFWDVLWEILLRRGLLLFPAVAGSIGLFLGAAEGIMCRNPVRASLCGLVGLAVGFCLGWISLICGCLIFFVVAMVIASIAVNPNQQPGAPQTPRGFALVILMMGRAAAWAVAAIPAGLGQGIALLERRIVLNGIVGGVLGGLLGGLLFDPIAVLFENAEVATVDAATLRIICLSVGVIAGLLCSAIPLLADKRFIGGAIGGAVSITLAGLLGYLLLFYLQFPGRIIGAGVSDVLGGPEVADSATVSRVIILAIMCLSVGLFIGLVCTGIVLKQVKIVVCATVIGLMGGILSGLSFVLQESGRATASRGVGLMIIGLSVGLFVGLVEGWTKTAWLLMRAGPLAGKQFVMFRDTTVLGSSPKAEVYLFKDEAIEPRHAMIYNRGGRFEIEDCNTRDGTYVNGVPIKRQLLKHGDQVVLGKTVLEFQLKETRPK